MNNGQNVSDASLLLSPKPLRSFLPEEFVAYVRSLYGIRVKKSAAKASTGPSKLSARLTKTGKLSITSRRDWKWITRSEQEHFGNLLGVPMNEVWLYCKKAGFTVVEDAE